MVSKLRQTLSNEVTVAVMQALLLRSEAAVLGWQAY
jgi:hypothetical protein